MTVVDVCVERGYAASVRASEDQELGLSALFGGSSKASLEERTSSANWVLSEEGQTTNDENFWSMSW